MENPGQVTKEASNSYKTPTNERILIMTEWDALAMAYANLCKAKHLIAYRAPEQSLNQPGGPHQPHQFTLREETGLNPSPVPWLAAVSGLIDAISLKGVADNMPKGAAKVAVIQKMDDNISSIIDDMCGTKSPSSPYHWPFPGPNPMIFQAASALGLFANTVEVGKMRQDILQVAGQLIQKGFAVGASE